MVTERLENELILQPLRHFTYVTTNSPMKMNSFSNLSVTSPTSQLILQWEWTHSPTFPSIHLRYNSFSNPSVASPTSQLILKRFFCFSYVTGSSLTSPGEPPMFWTAVEPGSGTNTVLLWACREDLIEWRHWMLYAYQAIDTLLSPFLLTTASPRTWQKPPFVVRL